MDKSVKERIVEFAKAKQITIRDFERKSGLSNGYVNAMRKGLGTEKLENVLSAFPDLSRDWLLYGEGPMLTSSSDTSIVNGDHSSQAVGDGATATNSDGVKECLEIIRKQQESIDKLVDAIAALSHNPRP
jgi:hypothetical protein